MVVGEYNFISATATRVIQALEPTNASQVYVFNEAVGAGELQPVSNVADKLGRIRSLSTYTTTSDVGFPQDILASKRLYAGYARTLGHGGGVYSSVPDVVRWLLQKYGDSSDVDWGRMADLAWLQGFRVDTWINAPTTPWEWIEGVLVPFLPAVVRRGAQRAVPRSGSSDGHRPRRHRDPGRRPR